MSEDNEPTLAEVKAIARATYAEQLNDAQKRLDFAVGYAQAGLKALFLVNGAAVIALLTFLGNGGGLTEERAIFWAFLWFTCGIASVLVAYFGAFFSQSHYMQHSISQAWNAQAEAHNLVRRSDTTKSRKFGMAWEATAQIGALGGLVFFVVGAFVALDGIT